MKSTAQRCSHCKRFFAFRLPIYLLDKQTKKERYFCNWECVSGWAEKQ